MKILIVYAHHDKNSFNNAMKDFAVSVLRDQGHEVKISDLYAMKFKAIADERDFTEISNPNEFNYIMEQINASQNKKFVNDIKEEQEKLKWADFVIFQFPFWWTSVPAILKGWFDRVLSAGFAWGFGKIYENAMLRGKKAMLSITTGGPANMYTPKGANTDINVLLHNIHYNTLHFVGMDVLTPFIAYNVIQCGDENRKLYFEKYKQRLLSIEKTEPMVYHPLSDYDENMQLKS